MATYYVRTDGNDANTGLGSGAGQAWQTITKAIGATGINPGDTLYIAPGVYRGVFSAAFTNPTSEGQRIVIAGNPTASMFTGINAGPVILTNYLYDNVSFTTGDVLSIAKNFITIQDINIYGYMTTPTPFYRPFIANPCSGLKVYRCLFGQPSSNTQKNTVLINLNGGSTGTTFDKCIFLNGALNIGALAHTGQWDSQTVITDCIFYSQNTNSFNNSCIWLDPTSGHLGGVKIVNNTIYGVNGIRAYSALSSSFPSVIQNCYIEASATAITSDVTNTSALVQTYNILNSTTSVTNIASSATSKTNAFNPTNTSIGKIQGWGDYPFISPLSNIQASLNSGINTNSPATDIYGTTWLSAINPTIGASEFQSYVPGGNYLPTERNASTITIAPGSTSQSIELYLGATGLTASTAGLSARYNRTRTASVSIPLVARTIAQAWTSGGFAEVDATNMPGLYRLDIPDAALAAGADDVTVVVRGASGTNGAVMTVKLSSGGLTSAQTASAVWGASPAGYNDATTYGGVVNQIDSLVNSIDTGVTQTPILVWDELRANHTTAGTFGEYVNAELVTPVTSAALVRMGPYEVKADGLGASDPLDIQKGAQHGVDIQCVDGNGNGIDITSATVTAKVYNSGGSLVDTYSCTATYAADGRATFTIDTTVTNSPGTYTATITRTTGASDTQVFGPLRIYVRDI